MWRGIPCFVMSRVDARRDLRRRGQQEPLQEQGEPHRKRHFGGGATTCSCRRLSGTVAADSGRWLEENATVVVRCQRHRQHAVSCRAFPSSSSLSHEGWGNKTTTSTTSTCSPCSAIMSLLYIALHAPLHDLLPTSRYAGERLRSGCSARASS
jgi:hypothetical protein